MNVHKAIVFLSMVVVGTVSSFSMSAFADQELSNRPFVASDEMGRCYAKSIPEHSIDPFSGPRSQGWTGIYVPSPEGDILVWEHDWYSYQLYLQCDTSFVPLSIPDDVDLRSLEPADFKAEWSKPDWKKYAEELRRKKPDAYIVRLGPWARGSAPNDDDLALAFYKNDKLLKRYSTLDIAVNERADCHNYVSSVSHYDIFQYPPRGIAYEEGRRTFQISTVDGRDIVFSLTNGKILAIKQGQPGDTWKRMNEACGAR
ncbi:MAG: hypothetical protein ACLFV8_10960 [Alphaproteobacteria bacterium]